MGTYHKWALLMTGFLAVFVAANYVIWKGFTEDILTFKKYYNGGLDRMGYIVGSKHYRNPEYTLPRKHMESTEYAGQHVDVLTIGDSFSNIRENGKDPLYQDWIASFYNLSVLNIPVLKGMDELSTIVTLLNSGYLDEVKPRFIIIESVERGCIGKYAREVDFTSKMPLQAVEEYYRRELKSGYPEINFINTGNFKFIYFSLLYEFSDHAFYSKVYMKNLSASFFSVKKDRRLLFYHEDIKNIPLATVDAIRLLNDNFNRLSILLRKKRITLFFMPAPDKYNIYSDYIVENPYPKSVFFEILRKMPRTYVFVDTKTILSEEIRKGERDVYYADDTHWSWKAAKKITESMKFQ